MIKKFLTGQIILWKSYWFYFILANNLITTLIDKFAIKISLGNMDIYLLFYFTKYIINIFFSIGVWNSSKNYIGSSIIKKLVQIIVILNIIAIILLLWFNYIEYFQKSVLFYILTIILIGISIYLYKISIKNNIIKSEIIIKENKKININWNEIKGFFIGILTLSSYIVIMTSYIHGIYLGFNENFTSFLFVTIFPPFAILKGFVGFF